MVLGGDEDLPGAQVAHRMISAPVPIGQLGGFSPEREADQLMSQADTEGRQALAGELADVRDGVLHCRGVPGPLERKSPSGFSSRTCAALVSAGTTVTRQPAWTSIRTMLRFIP